MIKRLHKSNFIAFTIIIVFGAIYLGIAYTSNIEIVRIFVTVVAVPIFL